MGNSKKIKEMLSKLIKRSDMKLTAKDAYLKAKYNRIEDDETRLKIFKENLESLIAAKCEMCSYCCVVQVEEDLQKYTNDIINEYKNLGYTVVNLKEVIEGVKSNFIFFTWENAEL